MQVWICPGAPRFRERRLCEVCIFALDFSTQNLPGTPQTVALQRKSTTAYKFPALDPSCLLQPHSMPEVFLSAPKNPPHSRLSFCSSRGGHKSQKQPCSREKALQTWCWENHRGVNVGWKDLLPSERRFRGSLPQPQPEVGAVEGSPNPTEAPWQTPVAGDGKQAGFVP